MRTWTRLALVGLLGGALLGCDNTSMGTDGGPRPDGGPVPDSGPRPDGAPEPDGGPRPECPDEVNVSGEISTNTTWDCPVYLLQGRVFVVNNATLTIRAGTIIYGDTASAETSALIVTRGSRLVAEGTASAPIVMTSGNPEGTRAPGDWGGLVLLGSARTNDGTCAEDGDPSTPMVCDAPGYLEDRIEGIGAADPRARYGGTDDTSDCGSLRYVRIEFAGNELSPNNELNGLTVGGCGSRTRLSYIQVHRGSDDGVEFFGGTASLDHVVISGAQDDSLDYDEGWRGNGQFIVIHQFPGDGDFGIEADNNGPREAAEPRTRPFLWNVTMIGTATTKAMLLREGHEGRLSNFIVHTFDEAPDIQARQTNPADSWPANFVIQHSFFYMVRDFRPEDLSSSEVYALARTMDATLPETRNRDTETMEQQRLISRLERERLNDDMSFDENAEIRENAARSNRWGVDPGIASVSPTAPSYVPTSTMLNGQATPAFNEHAPAGFGDTTATYSGAFAPGGTNWAAGWTAYPAN